VETIRVGIDIAGQRYMFDLVMNAKCPRCYAESLILACKLLTGNRVTAQTWVCSSCETVFDRADLKSEHRRSNRENISQWEKNTSWAGVLRPRRATAR